MPTKTWQLTEPDYFICNQALTFIIDKIISFTSTITNGWHIVLAASIRYINFELNPVIRKHMRLQHFTDVYMKKKKNISNAFVDLYQFYFGYKGFFSFPMWYNLKRMSELLHFFICCPMIHLCKLQAIHPLLWW